MVEFLKKAKESSRIISQLTGKEKNRILFQMADILRKNEHSIIEENKRDMNNADKNDLSSALKDRLLLDSDRIHSMATAIEEIAALKEPPAQRIVSVTPFNVTTVQVLAVPVDLVMTVKLIE